MKKLRAAIIGLGRMGAEPTTRLGKLPHGWSPISHAESIISTAELELESICDIEIEKVRKFSQVYNVSKGFTDYKELIKITKPDIISIATRTNLKEEIINYALNHNVRGIYVEKPLSTSIAQCERILDNVQASGVKLVYGTQRRGMPFFRQAKELAYSNQLGHVESISFEYGAGMLLWSLPHLADLITFYANATRVESISAIFNFNDVYTKDSIFIDEDPTVEIARIKMSNGIPVLLTPGKGKNIRIHLSEGIIHLNGDAYSVDVFTEGEFKGRFTELTRKYGEPVRSGTQELFNDLTQSVLHDRPLSLVSSAEILCGTEILFGMIESALRKGTEINYQEIRKDLVVTGRFGNLYA